MAYPLNVCLPAEHAHKFTSSHPLILTLVDVSRVTMLPNQDSFTLQQSLLFLLGLEAVQSL